MHISLLKSGMGFNLRGVCLRALLERGAQGLGRPRRDHHPKGKDRLRATMQGARSPRARIQVRVVCVKSTVRVCHISYYGE